MTGTQALARNVAVIACAISAGVHAGLVPDHLAEDPKLGVAFALASVLLVALAVALAKAIEAVGLIAALRLYEPASARLALGKER